MERKLSRGFSLGANYTWSSNFTDTEDVATSDQGITFSSPSFPQDTRNRRNEWARSVFDRPHRLSLIYTYQIPGFSNSSPILRQTLSGWQLSGFTEVQSGQPFTVVVGVDTLGSGDTTSGRPNANPGGILVKDPATGDLRSFTIPKDGTGIVTAPFVVNSSTGAVTLLRNSMPFGGTLGRNTFRGPGLSNTNISLQKHFSLAENTKLEIRGDFINVLNHDNFQNPDSNMNSSTFGRQVLTPITDARQVLIGAKLSF